MSGVFIDDGHTLAGLLPARAGRHGRVKFTYRRCLPRREYRWRNVDRTQGDNDFEADCSLICEHVSAFELVDAAVNGEVAPDASTPAKLKAALEKMESADLNAMVLHILGKAETKWDGPEKNG